MKKLSTTASSITSSIASDEEWQEMAATLPFASTQRYNDIMDCSHPQPHGRAPLSAAQRAAQFMPFAALSGYEALVRRTAQEQLEAVTQADTPVDGIEQGWIPA